MIKKLSSKFMVALILLIGLFTLGLTGFMNLDLVKAQGSQNETVSFNEAIKGKNYLHFIIRNWHTTYSDDLMITSENEDFYFSVINGFITKDDNGYEFYLIEKQNNPEEILAGDREVLTKITDANKDQFKKDIEFGSNGRVTVYYNTEFTDESPNGYSISAGQAAVTVDENQEALIIDFETNQNIHLVKGHLFYENEGTKVNGNGERNNFDKEQDTFLENDDKYYSTLPGLHTDKTAEATDAEREFDLILESWFGDIDPTDIGLILDASGSMGFTSEDLDPIIITDEKYQRVTTETQNLEDVFLSQEEVDEILDSRKTDNSRLSQTGYNYYLYDPRDLVKEYVPLGYWSGDSNKINSEAFSSDNYLENLVGNYPFNKDPVDGQRRGWMNNDATSNSTLRFVERLEYDYHSFEGDSNVDYSFIIDDENKKDIAGSWPRTGEFEMAEPSKVNSGFKINESYNGVAIEDDLLDDNGQFTLSFKIKYDGNNLDSNAKENLNNRLDLFYIGPAEGNTSENNYFRIIRETGSSKNRLKVLLGKKEVASINNVFSQKNTEDIYITLVMDKDYATIYYHGPDKDGKLALTEKVDIIFDNPIDFENYRIILNGIKNNDYSGMNISVDDIKLYNQALFAYEIDKLIKNDTTSSAVYVATNEDQVIGAVTDSNLVGLRTEDKRGWYYINPSSTMYSYYFNQMVQTSKTLLGLRSNNSITYTYDVTKPVENYQELPNEEQLTYTSNSASPVKFYIDHQGYLRCLYYANDRENGFGTSYVYENSDMSYVKMEALQRALGGFSAKLSSVSPESKISAVRFSTEDFYSSDLNKLVLLDWTNDTNEMQKMLSLERGLEGSDDNVGGTLEGDVSEGGLEQFNYGLTGGTFTWTGLKSYRDFLSENINQENKDNKKSLIIFTDGKDQEFDAAFNKLLEKQGEDTHADLAQKAVKKTKAYALAKELKDQGYTIYTVMLSGGTIVPSSDPEVFGDYEQAKAFLLELSGANGTPDNEKENYFYDTHMQKLDGLDEDMNTIDALTNIFSNEIIEKFEFQLHDYSVKDYIDPRFDLITGNNELIRLNSNGQIVIEKEGQEPVEENLLSGEEPMDGSLIVQEENESYLPIRVTSLTDISKGAFNAQLHFDNVNNSYYVKWVNQDIKGVPIQAVKFTLWRSRLKLRAKDDFLGGNVVLTNGIDAHQNYVYSEKDDNASSGVDRAEPSESYTFYSKGFPRTTVNVGDGNSTDEGNQIIYLGENLSEEDVLSKIQNMVNTSQDLTQDIVVDYLSRYLGSDYNEEGKRLEDIMNSEGLTIPYSYLKDLSEGSDQSITLTGTDHHEEDILGNLTYTISSTPSLPDGPVKDRNSYFTNLEIKYSPNTNLDERRELTNTLVQENYHQTYQWDPEYKPVVGNKLETKTYDYAFKTLPVSGEVALEFDTSNLQDTDKEILMEAAYKVGDPEAVVYSGILQRSYEEITEPVAEFEITAGDILGLGDKASLIVKFSQSKLFSDYEFVKDNGLPIGDYTIEMNKDRDVESLVGFEFTPVAVYSEEEVGRRSDLEQIYENVDEGIEISHYLGSVDEDSQRVQLGTDKETPGKTYTDERYGLFVLKVEPGVGDLEISKKVTGSQADSSDEFTFKITLDDTSINATIDGVDFANGVGTITLTGGQFKVIQGLPLGLHYTVEEIDSKDYVPKAPDNTEGKITKETTKVEFENIKDLGSLEIAKKIDGSEFDSKKEFTFNIQISNPKVNGLFSGIEFKEGFAKVYITGNNSIVISDLPSGASYTVEEEPDTEYELVSSLDEKGEIPAGGTVTAEFTNRLKSQEPDKSYEVSIQKWHKKVKQDTFHKELNDQLTGGDTVEYMIEVKNTLDPITNVVVTDPIPGELIVDTESIRGELSDKTSVAGSFNKADKNIKWSIPRLGTSETATLYFDVKIPDYQKEFFWINHAHLTYTEGEAESPEIAPVSLALEPVAALKADHPEIIIVGSNEKNTDHSLVDHPSFYVENQPNVYSNDVVEHMTVSTTVEPPQNTDPVLNDPQLTKEQSVNDGNRTKTLQSVKAGDVITYYLTVRNTTNAVMSNVEIKDTIPTGLIWIENQASNGYSYNARTNTISWKINQLDVNRDITVWFNVRVPSVETNTTYINQFEMNFNENRNRYPYPSNKVETEEKVEEQIFGPNLIVEKKQQVTRNNSEGYSDSRDGEITSDYIEVREGDIITYYISVLNNGDTVAEDVVITDPVPDGLIFIKNSASNSEVFTQQGNTLVWKIGSLQPGESSQVEVQFQVVVPEIVEEVYWRNIAYASYGGSSIQTPSNQVVIGDPPTDSVETPDTDSTPNKPMEVPDQDVSSATTVEPAVSTTTTTTTKTEVTQTGASPQTGVTSDITFYILLGILALMALIGVMAVHFGNRRKKD